MSSQLTLNLVEGSVSFSFTPQAANDLQAAINELLQTLKAKTAQASSGAGGKPTRLKSMEYRYTGDVFLEIECNPNIWATPFAAKVLVTLRDDRIRLRTEAELTRVVEDVNLYLEQAG